MESLFDQATLGLGWACLLALLIAWWHGGKVRWTMVRLALVFLAFATFIGFVWSATHAEPLNYNGALGASERIGGGRYLYPALMSWLRGRFRPAGSRSTGQTSSFQSDQRKAPQIKFWSTLTWWTAAGFH